MPSVRRGKPECGRSAQQCAIEREQRHTGQARGGEQVGIDPSDSQPMERMPFNEGHDFQVAGDDWRRKCCQQIEDSLALPDVPTGQFTPHKGMKQHFADVEQYTELGMAPPQVLDPHRRVDKHGQRAAAGRRRRIGRRAGSLPPSAASRLALSVAMSVRKAACTTAVFSSRPLSLRACSMSWSSMISVVLICINMPY